MDPISTVSLRGRHQMQNIKPSKQFSDFLNARRVTGLKPGLNETSIHF
jgi:hypothetical protein